MNRWYLVSSIIVVMLVRLESQRAETPDMRRNRQTIEQMSRVERERLRHNFEQFQKLSTGEREQLRTVHTAVQNEPALNETLTKFHEWLATLSLSDREDLLATTDPTDRLQMMRRMMVQSEVLPGDRPGSEVDAASLSPFMTLRVSPYDYERMMAAGARWVEMSATPAVTTPVGQLEHHLAVMSAIMNRILPDWQASIARSPGRPRPSFPDSLRMVLLEQISESKTKHILEDRPALQQNMMSMVLLARGLFDETRRVTASLRPTAAELAQAYERIPESRRKSIDQLPREAADRVIRQQWIMHRLSPEASQQLSRLSSLFDRLWNRSPNGPRLNEGTSRPRRDGNGFQRPATSSEATP